MLRNALVVVALLLCASLAHGDGGGDAKTSLLDVLAELRDLQAAVRKLGEVSSAHRDTIDATQTALAATQARLHGNEEQVSALSGGMTEVRAALNQQQVQLESASQQMGDLRGVTAGELGGWGLRVEGSWGSGAEG